MHLGVQVNKGQEALEKKLGMLETHQKEIHDSLVSIEGEAARLYQVLLPYALLSQSPDTNRCTGSRSVSGHEYQKPEFPK